MKLSLHNADMYQKHGVAHGISESTEVTHNEHVQQAIARVNKNIEDKAYGFIEILKDEKILREIKTIFASLRWAKTLVVVGIGGSDLGGRAVQQALEDEHPPMVVFFHGDSTDPVAISRLLKQIDLDDTVFCIISKSGETIETISQYVFFKEMMKQHTEEWTEHFVFITDQAKGILRTEADAHGIATLPISTTVGGRFSVLTTVGLFPSAAMGVDIDQMIAGANDVVENYQEIAQKLATDQYYLYKQDMYVNIFMPYAVQLEEFARWYRQLWGESLGKEGKGILPIQARGPADQHSQVQFYTEGALFYSLLFLRVEKVEEDFAIENVDLDDVQYLEGHSFHEILNLEQKTTGLALKKLGRPSASLSIEKVSAFSLGQLFMLFELAVVYLAEMLEVDAFNQPGVEEGKQMMYALLGRKGFEEKRKDVEKLDTGY